MNRRNRCTWIALLPLLAYAPSHAFGAAIDYAAIDNPQAIDLPDRTVKSRWNALFESDPDWIARQVAYLTEHVGDRAPTLLAARLLYNGDPWVRRTGDQTNIKRWGQADLETKLTILREIRALRDPVLGDVLKHFLATETNHDLMASALATLWFLDAKSAPDFAVRLADPRPTNHLPGASQPAVRQDALRFLLGVRGPEAPETRRALDWALLQAKGGERNHAVSLLTRGSVPDLLKAAILRFDAERAKGELGDDGASGLAVACSRLGSEIDSELAAALVAIAVNGEREIAAPAATALASNLRWTATVPISEIAKRATTDQDPVVHHALMNLLLRVNTNAGTIDTAGSPWNALSAHRERLSRWEWEQYVR
jgi:hypothetical protein